MGVHDKYNVNAFSMNKTNIWDESYCRNVVLVFFWLLLPFFLWITQTVFKDRASYECLIIYLFMFSFIWSENVSLKEHTTQQNNLQSLSTEVSGSRRSTQTSTDIDTHPLLDSVAVKSVCEMGYTKEQVVKPLQIIKDSGQGNQCF